MKIGISIKLDVTKIDKARLFKGKTGAQYLDCTAFIDIDNKGQYGDNGMVTQDVSKEEKQREIRGAILGNGTVFWRDDGQQIQQAGAAPVQPTPHNSPPVDEGKQWDDVPF